MNDTANKPNPAKPLLTIEENLEEKYYVRLYGKEYYIKHHDELGIGALARLDMIMRRYGHLMSKAQNPDEEFTEDEGDALEEPLMQVCKMFLDAPPAVIERLTSIERVRLAFAFTEALGVKSESPDAAPSMNRATRRRQTGAKSSPRSSASTAASPKAG